MVHVAITTDVDAGTGVRHSLDLVIHVNSQNQATTSPSVLSHHRLNPRTLAPKTEAGIRDPICDRAGKAQSLWRVPVPRGDAEGYRIRDSAFTSTRFSRRTIGRPVQGFKLERTSIGPQRPLPSGESASPEIVRTGLGEPCTYLSTTYQSLHDGILGCHHASREIEKISGDLHCSG